MEQHEEPGELWDRSGDPADRPFDPDAERWAGIVRALALEDPRFVRRVTSPGPGGAAVGDLMIVVGLVATVLLGVLPLGVGLQTGIVALVVVGAAGTLLLPVGAPLAVRAFLRHVRPLMP
ncbi:DUF3040 domain-containing protein [Actinomycetospora lemnae]|uniref:DUF3040 domain-containing protein n=1 Tax=Actinomycetospora lemnae TaxID=3019891 RepID=A0ABT5T0U0_9PSEU|nr:DUF3040 domain-containing protein [Actinomycetospora sp. DW7H6]MDD7968738.1 DUF3040 domain-containing protein [Actinomycetospora sp. DW7H6]